MGFQKILDRIYSERNISSNIAIFTGSIVALMIYILTKDIYLSSICSIGIFALTKVISVITIPIILSRVDSWRRLQTFSESEKNVIQQFITRGTSYITLSTVRRGEVELDDNGFESLHVRGIINFVEYGSGDGPAGFQLSEDIYKLFLNAS